MVRVHSLCCACAVSVKFVRTTNRAFWGIRARSGTHIWTRTNKHTCTHTGIYQCRSRITNKQPNSETNADQNRELQTNATLRQTFEYDGPEMTQGEIFVIHKRVTADTTQSNPVDTEMAIVMQSWCVWEKKKKLTTVKWAPTLLSVHLFRNLKSATLFKSSFQTSELVTGCLWGVKETTHKLNSAVISLASQARGLQSHDVASHNRCKSRFLSALFSWNLREIELGKSQRDHIDEKVMEKQKQIPWRTTVKL